MEYLPGILSAFSRDSPAATLEHDQLSLKQITLQIEDPANQNLQVTVKVDEYNNERPVQIQLSNNYNSAGTMNLTADDAAVLVMALKNISEAARDK